MSGDIGGGRRHWRGVKGVISRRRDHEWRFDQEHRVVPDADAIANRPRETVQRDQVSYYLVDFVVGRRVCEDEPTAPSLPLGYAMYVDVGVEYGIEQPVRLKPDEDASYGYRLRDERDLPAVIGVEPEAGEPLTADLQDRYRRILHDAHGVGGEFRGE